MNDVFTQMHITSLSASQFGCVFMEADSEQQASMLRAMKKASTEFWGTQCVFIAEQFNGDEAAPVADWLQLLIDCLRDRK